MPKRRKHPLIHWTGVPLLFLIYCLATTGSANEPEAPPAGGTSHDVYWSLTGPQGHAGYLLGTVHSEDPRVLEFTQSFLGQLSNCKQFAMELVPDMGTMQRLVDYMNLPEDQKLSELVGQARYLAVQEAMGSYAMPEARMERMKPWAVMLSLSLPPPETGVFLDYQLSLRASGAGLSVSGLETLEDQLSFLENMTLEQQIELLDQALDDFARVQEVHDLLVDSYLYGSLEKLESVASSQMGELSPATEQYFMEEGIDARNRRMAVQALPLLAQGCTFIAVGALHLPGEQGLLKLLAQAGYTPEQLPSPFLIISNPPE